MNRVKLLSLILFSTLLAVYAGAESIQLTSYYPSPKGAYDRLMLVPRADLVGACDMGTMYVSSTDNLLRYCQDDGSGNGVWGGLPGVWTSNASDDVFLSESATNTDLRVGVGDETPDAIFEVSASGGADALIMASANDASDGDIFIVQNDGDVGINTLNPSAQLEITGAGNSAATTAMRVVNSDGDPIIFVQNDQNVGIGTELNLDNRLEVGGNVEIVNVGTPQLRITSLDGAGVPVGNYSIGMSAASTNLKLNSGATVGANPGLVVEPSGDVTIEGDLIIDNGGNKGVVQLQFISGAYYATYAP